VMSWLDQSYSLLAARASSLLYARCLRPLTPPLSRLMFYVKAVQQEDLDSAFRDLVIRALTRNEATKAVDPTLEYDSRSRRRILEPPYRQIGRPGAS
jgi:hypothetical protein